MGLGLHMNGGTELMIGVSVAVSLLLISYNSWREKVCVCFPIVTNGDSFCLLVVFVFI